MFAPTIPPGHTPDQSGIYFTNVGASLSALLVDGVVAVVGRSTDGPIGAFMRLRDASEVAENFGTGLGVDVTLRAFSAGAREVLHWRLGGGAPAAATHAINDSLAASVGTLSANPALHKGTRAWAYTLTDSLINPDYVELGVYRDGILADTVRFQNYAALGSGSGIGEPQALANAVAAAGTYFTFTKSGDGSKQLARVTTPTALTGGVAATPDGGAHDAAMDALEGELWNVAVFDTEDTAAIQPSIGDWAEGMEARGLYRFVVLGDNTSTLASRQARARGYNLRNLLYVIDDFTEDGAVIDGAKAAGVVAGAKAAAGIADTIGGMLVSGVRDGAEITLPTPLGSDDVRASTLAGGLVFAIDPLRRVVIAEDVTTYTVSDGIHDPSLWSQSYVVSRLYRLQERIAVQWAARVRKVENNRYGQSLVVGDATREIRRMTDQGFLSGGTASLVSAVGKVARVRVAPIVQQKMAILIGEMVYS